MANAGNFSIMVADPYPCWCELRYCNGERIRFSHRELRDLKYVVDCAIQDAMLKLKEDAKEV